MQITSRNDTQSVLSIARHSTLAESVKDKNNSEDKGGAKVPLTTGGVSYSQGYSSFQSSLATMSVDTAAPLSGAERIVANGGGLDIDALTQSDLDFIQKTTGLTWPNDKTGNWVDADGNAFSSGAAYEKANALVWAMSDMRIYAATFGTSGDMFQGTGDITPGQLREYFARYQGAAARGEGPFSAALLKDLDAILDKLTSEPS